MGINMEVIIGTIQAMKVMFIYMSAVTLVMVAAALPSLIFVWIVRGIRSYIDGKKNNTPQASDFKRDIFRKRGKTNLEIWREMFKDDER